jgi:hypothetical protein
VTTTVRIPPRTCHVCGVPLWACFGPGFITKVKAKAENRFRRDRQVSVWCCSKRCAMQANALAELGPASHKWPISLAEFAAQRGTMLDIREPGADRTETIAESSVNTGAAEAEQQDLDQQPNEAVSVREIVRRRGGRPRKWKSEAERLRDYRERKREETHDAIPLATVGSVIETVAT